MEKDKYYHCYRCGIEMINKPVRLSLQEYGISRYKQYTPTGLNIDLCTSCFKTFVEWVGVNECQRKNMKKESKLKIYLN